MPDINEMTSRNGRILKEDGSTINQGDVLAAGVKKEPVHLSDTVSIPASGSGTAIVTVPSGKRFKIKQVNITKGADVTVLAQAFDGKGTGQTASYDIEATFGDLLTADTDITVSGSNASLAAENLTIEVIGYSVDK
jgi:hypothetical protein